MTTKLRKPATPKTAAKPAAKKAAAPKKAAAKKPAAKKAAAPKKAAAKKPAAKKAAAPKKVAAKKPAAKKAAAPKKAAAKNPAAKKAAAPKKAAAKKPAAKKAAAPKKAVAKKPAAKAGTATDGQLVGLVASLASGSVASAGSGGAGGQSLDEAAGSPALASILANTSDISVHSEQALRQRRATVAHTPSAMRDVPPAKSTDVDPIDGYDTAMLALKAALEKKAVAPVLLDVHHLCSYCNYQLILSGNSDRQVGAISDGIHRALKKSGLGSAAQEGVQVGHWALLDYGDLVVHVFHHPIREHYDLEGLWNEAVRVPLEVPDEAKYASEVY